MNNYGHNELAEISNKLTQAFQTFEKKEAQTLEAAIKCGHLLNAGREKFTSDEQFGQWIKSVCGNLAQTRRHTRVAMMWAAANPEELAEAKTYGNARTVRGLHKAWNEAQNQIEEQKAAEAADFTLAEFMEVFNEVENPKPKKARELVVPPYDVATTMGALKGMMQMYGKRYEGTEDQASEVLFHELIKGCDVDEIGLSIARDSAKWFLGFKAVMDQVEIDVIEFLNEKPDLKVVH